MHQDVDLKVLYFGTPVVLIGTRNPGGSANLAPMSSAWWLGEQCMLGMNSGSQTTRNLLRERGCTLNLPSAGLAAAGSFAQGVAESTRTSSTQPAPAPRGIADAVAESLLIVVPGNGDGQHARMGQPAFPDLHPAAVLVHIDLAAVGDRGHVDGVVDPPAAAPADRTGPGQVLRINWANAAEAASPSGNSVLTGSRSDAERRIHERHQEHYLTTMPNEADGISVTPDYGRHRNCLTVLDRPHRLSGFCACGSRVRRPSSRHARARQVSRLS
jgi:hypothetical protein